MNDKQPIAVSLLENAGFRQHKTRGNAYLLFNENYISSKYAEKFGIQEDEQFDEAFIQVTSGVGNEASKINSVISSSLLSLLVFYPLFKNKGKDSYRSLCINGIEYTNAFFEVRNNVIGYPSCIDVVLQSKDENTLLFLESKFTEPLDELKDKKTYGKSYIKLYKKLQNVLSCGHIQVDENKKEKLILTSDRPRYIEGIKQSISHLIGLVKGPQDVDSYPYDKEYCDAYKKAYGKATTLIYATIAFDTEVLDKDRKNEYLRNDNSDSYKGLYQKVIGDNGAKIVEVIRETFDENRKKRDKEIVVFTSPLTYQNMLQENKDYSLTKTIKAFYGL